MDIPKEAIEYKKEIERYIICMTDIKGRLLKVKDYLESIESYEGINFHVEFVYLQFRNIIELIALAGLAAYQAHYTKGYDSLKKEWRPKRILEFIENINPNFFPIPVDIIDKEPFPTITPNFKLVEVKTGFLTKDEFLSFYDICSDNLHAQNPFANTKDPFKSSTLFISSFQKIERLLAIHLVNMKDAPHQFIVLMDFLH